MASLKMRSVRFNAPRYLPSGTHVRFPTERGADQYRRRAGSLKVVQRGRGKNNQKAYQFDADDIFLVVKPVQFKAGEEVDTDYSPPKSQPDVMFVDEDAESDASDPSGSEGGDSGKAAGDGADETGGGADDGEGADDGQGDDGEGESTSEDGSK